MPLVLESRSIRLNIFPKITPFVALLRAFRSHSESQFNNHDILTSRLDSHPINGNHYSCFYESIMIVTREITYNSCKITTFYFWKRISSLWENALTINFTFLLQLLSFQITPDWSFPCYIPKKEKKDKQDMTLIHCYYLGFFNIYFVQLHGNDNYNVVVTFLQNFFVSDLLIMLEGLKEWFSNGL